MSGRLSGRVALISGAASGMGASHARAFVEHGAHVVLGDIADEAGGELAAELGEAAVYVHLDVTQAADWAAAVAEAVERFGGLNVLVNNAGILDGGPLGTYTEQQWRRILDINLTGAFLGLSAARDALVAARPSSVINISSAAGMQGVAGMHGYTASKYGLRGLTKSAALELAADGVRVNSVHPGAVLTPMIAGMAAEYGVSQVDRTQSTLTRMALPEEVTALVVYLASEESSFSTGAEFLVDGGMTAGPS
ncbi:3alpha(or 20beta)-hydroxysteroid dehydrogenase [Thermomonospora echinospora]|uniref:3alpha(Or 20beta)-hydroxysteroid dehydrogenase n=1 Tax=Thermomonospora echinospora TaxID=1992 RepID=A0A1H6DVZ8_9ACTN|nr:SDR family oxidoreductase [Thermomonospora echinospora]SEG88906.1 3alpha(or 20beta)-hydroxysteroid dehydrogenase [Thermomonospora echinospora]